MRNAPPIDRSIERMMVARALVPAGALEQLANGLVVRCWARQRCEARGGVCPSSISLICDPGLDPDGPQQARLPHPLLTSTIASGRAAPHVLAGRGSMRGTHALVGRDRRAQSEQYL